jgi:holo-[acyl-carrier protein] synthase
VWIGFNRRLQSPQGACHSSGNKLADVGNLVGRSPTWSWASCFGDPGAHAAWVVERGDAMGAGSEVLSVVALDLWRKGDVMTQKGATASDWRVGIDVVTVQEISGSVERFGDRYLRRVFTSGELESCQNPGGLRVSRLAAYFAAKEATIKALQPEDGRPDLRSIEIVRPYRSRYEIRLSGGASRCAERAEIVELSVSLTEADGIAAAAVIAARHPGEPAIAIIDREGAKWAR